MHGGGDETRNAQAFRTLSIVPRASCTNLTPTRATASGSALLAFFMATKAITYLQAEGDVEACFAARGAHNLFLEGEAQRYAILGSIAGVSLVDGIKELEWPALGLGKTFDCCVHNFPFDLLLS